MPPISPRAAACVSKSSCRKLAPLNRHGIIALGRILFWVFIAFMIYLLYRGLVRSRAKRDAPPSAPPRAEDMVTCARCGVNMPRSEAREEAGKLLCRENPQCH
jgi:uncharacterized protein